MLICLTYLKIIVQFIDTDLECKTKVIESENNLLELDTNFTDLETKILLFAKKM